MVWIETVAARAKFGHLTRLLPITSLALFSLLALIGCGGADNRAGVSGKVLLDGRPVAKGTISFIPVEGTEGPTSGGDIINGEYAVTSDKGVAVGKNRVIIRSVVKSGRKINMGNGDVDDEWVQMIPARYNKQSDLICIIQAGSNQQDFELQSKLPRQ
ncbi:MAG: hypothetical protein JXM70_08835 [Pirellulales bacterium]|nr:hypothetical protein [Pirellulales bacterium]